MSMILRDKPTMTLADLAEDSSFSARYAEWGGPLANISVRLEDAEPVIVFGDHEVPATAHGLEAIGSYVDIPTKFLGRIEPDEQQFVISRRIERASESNVSIAWTTEGGVKEVRKASAVRVQAEEILDSVIQVMPQDSLVVQWVNDSSDLMIDTIVPLDHTRYTGGDKKVGDITKGGVRFGQDRQRNLAPWAQPYIYRLRCTNGMELPDSTLKIDARGMEEFEILASLRQKGRDALEDVTKKIDAFYDLRSQPLGSDRTGALHRIAREAELPERTAFALESALPGYMQEDFDLGTTFEATMFHLVNLLTNAANNPNISLASQRRLQRVGGNLVIEHAARCDYCHSKLN